MVVIDHSERYGVVLMDLEMPMMDGYEATVKIRESELSNHYPRTYICGLSAYTDQSTNSEWETSDRSEAEVSRVRHGRLSIEAVEHGTDDGNN